MRKSRLSFGPICTCKADLDPLQYSARLIKWGAVIWALMKCLMFLKEGGWCHPEHVGHSGVGEISPGEGNKQTAPRHRVIPAGYQDGQCKLPSMVNSFSLCVDSSSEFPGLRRPSTQFPDPVLLQVIDRADMVPGFWLALPGPWTQVYTLEVWAYEPLGMTLQIALFVTWTCDNWLWPWPSIFPTLHIVPCSVSPH